MYISIYKMFWKILCDIVSQTIWRAKVAVLNCDMCSYYVYDEETECYVCDVDLDEDELVRFLQGTNAGCPYFSMNDEYAVVKKQM